MDKTNSSNISNNIRYNNKDINDNDKDISRIKKYYFANEEKNKYKNKENNNISYEYNNKKEETTINNQIRKDLENTFKFTINNIFFNNKEKSLPMKYKKNY